MKIIPAGLYERPMSNKKTIKALVVDDEKVVRDFLSRFLTSEDIETKTVEDGFKAIEAAKKEKFDIVFLEISMFNGIEVLRELKKITPDSVYVVMAAYLTDDLWEKAKKEGVSICFKKPFEKKEPREEKGKIRCLRGL